MLNKFPVYVLLSQVCGQGYDVKAGVLDVLVAQTIQVMVAQRRPVAAATGDLEHLARRALGICGRAQGTAEDGGGKEGVEVLAVELGQVAGQRIGQVSQVSTGMAQDEGIGEVCRIVRLGALGGRVARDGAPRGIHGSSRCARGGGCTL